MTLHTLLLSADPTSLFSELKTGEGLLLTVILLGMLGVAALVAVMAVHLYLTVRHLAGVAPEANADTRTFWQKFAGWVPMQREKDLIMHHSYDGIHELDNPTPPWFMYLFYGTIAFSVLYLVAYHVVDAGDLQIEEYTNEVAVAEKQREEYIRKVAGSINENTVTFVKDAPSLASGKVLYDQYCTACHGATGGGGVGPNLTDEYWLHGGDIKAVFHTIAEGVPEKGMVSWKKQLNPLQIQQVSSYILSLQGSKPAGAKEPQGEKVAPPLARR